MFKFQRFPLSIPLSKIEASINTLIDDGWIVMSHVCVASNDGKGFHIFGMLKQDEPAEADEPSGAAGDEISDSNGHVPAVAAPVSEPEIIPADQAEVPNN